MVVTIYTHVQTELIAYKVLSEHFKKEVKIIGKKVKVQKSRYQEHQIKKIGENNTPEKGALALFT
jgi:hypothetical protein